MDLLQALKYPFSNDPQWLKKVVATAVPVGLATIGTYISNFGSRLMSNDDSAFGGAVLFIGLAMQFVIGLAVSGYMLKAIRCALHEEPLPDWDDAGRLFRDGFRVFAMSMVYYTPVAVIMMIAIGAFVAVELGGCVALSQSGTEGLAALFDVGSMVAYVVGALLFAALCAAVSLFAVPAYLTLVRENSNVKECFQFGRIWRTVCMHFSSIIVFGLYVIAAFIVSAVPIICTCGIGAFVIKPFMLYIYAALYAQLARIIMPEAVDEVSPAYEAYE